MHYYSHNIADYRKDTSHLSTLEHGIYRELIDWYYLNESPIPKETQVVMRRLRLGSESDTLALMNVLNDFFTLEDDGYHQARCDAEIEKYQQKNDKNRLNGAKGGRPKANKQKEENHLGYFQEPNENPSQSQINPNQEPITKNQEPITNIKPLKAIKGDSQASLSKSAISTQCPQKEILKLWKTKLPNLAQPRSWEGQRQVNLKNRWLQASKASDYSPDGYQTEADGLQWWESFFDYIANDTKLAQGFESNNRTWKPDLEWVVNASNFQKIIDGKYDK